MQQPITPREEFERLLRTSDLKGLAEAFARGDIDWHVAEWKEFIDKIRSSTLQSYKEGLMEDVEILAKQKGGMITPKEFFAIINSKE